MQSSLLDMSVFFLKTLLQITESNMVKVVNERIPTSTKVLATLWLLANQESYRGVGDRFGMNKGNLFYVVKEIVQIWATCATEYICWPSDASSEAAEFERKWSFPGAVGAVDGCHIQIKAPRDEQAAYYNRKDFHSVVLQGCCNSNMIFTHVFVGSPGRMHDARVFANSELGQIIGGLPESQHILGDSAYPLQVNLMRPYKDNGHLTPVQLRFNTRHSKARAVIERAFSQLKGKFRRLKYLDMSDSIMIRKHIMAACMLHNIILGSRRPFIVEDEPVDDPIPIQLEEQASNATMASAREKRDRIASLL